MKRLWKDNSSLFYIIKFIGIFCACYFGTMAVIGLSAPVGYYSEFMQKHLDYVSLLRKSLLTGSTMLLRLLGYKANITTIYSLKIESGAGVHIGFDCLGYGVMSFWIAFVIANTGTLIKKTKWLAGGLLLIWLINISRISFFLVFLNKNWKIPLFNHHTWFNIFAYTLIFSLIYFYDRSRKIRPARVNKKAGVYNSRDRREAV